MVKKKIIEKKTGNAAAVVSTQKFAQIRKWNLWMGLLLLVQAVAIILIGTGKSFPVTTQYLALDTLASEATGGQTLAVATRHLFDVHLAWVIGAFLVLFAVAYLVAALWGRKWYEARLQQGLHDLRWLMFGIGGASLLAAVSLLGGIYELALLAAIKAFMVVGCLGILAAGIIRQGAGGKETSVSHMVCGVGTACIIAPLVILAIAAGGTVLYDGRIPGFVWGIYGTIILIFLLVGTLTHLRIVQRGRWTDALMTEKAYMLLGFLGASIVAWQMFAGVLQP